MAKRLLDTDLWQDIIFETFNKNERYFWLFLLTTRYGNLSGCFKMSPLQMAKETKMTENEILQLLKDFQEKHKLIYYNYEYYEIFIFNWYKYNWTKSPKLEAQIMRFLEPLKDIWLKETVKKMYFDYIKNDTVSIGYRYPSIPITIKESKQLNNNIKNYNTNDVKSILTKNNQEVENRFNIFWETDPKKQGKQTAKKKFILLKVDDELLDKIISNIEKRLKVGEWRVSEKQFIPNPTTYLNQARWNDEVIEPYKKEKEKKTFIRPAKMG